MACQGALDYDGNYWRIVKAVRQAKGKGATIINVPELAVTGYGCLDHFLEGDLYVGSKFQVVVVYFILTKSGISIRGK